MLNPLGDTAVDQDSFLLSLNVASSLISCHLHGTELRQRKGSIFQEDTSLIYQASSRLAVQMAPNLPKCAANLPRPPKLACNVKVTSFVMSNFLLEYKFTKGPTT